MTYPLETGQLARLCERASAPLLSLQGVDIRFEGRPILASVDLTCEASGILALLGPSGTGKSTLLRALSGALSAAGGISIGGDIQYGGAPLGPGNRPLLIEQKLPLILSTVIEFLAGGLPDRSALTRLQQIEAIRVRLAGAGLERLIPALGARLVDLTFSDRICLAIMRALGSDPALICLDEPTAGMDARAASAVQALIAREAERRAILLVTHHLGEAEKFADRVALLAGGRIVEQGPAEAFFSGPRTAAGRQFLSTGSCALPSPATPKLHLAPESRGPARLSDARSDFVADNRGPGGFRWLIDGCLGGAPQPGLLGDLETDLAALARVGTTLLVSLTEAERIAPAALARHGLRGLWFPIPDMEAPKPDAALRILVEAEQEMRRGGAVIYHCKAGLGRAGLMLVSHLIVRGHAASKALALARERKRQWVESLEQEQYLWDLELFLALKLDDQAPGGAVADAVSD
jgi:atypical dual specificity phosphatase